MTGMTTAPRSDELTVANVRSYLEAAGWSEHPADRTSLWVPSWDGNENLQVALPQSGMRNTQSDLMEAARVIAHVEQFSLAATVNSIVDGGADTLSVRLIPDEASGVAPLALAQESITALRSLIVGSAAALTSDALVLPSRRPAVVETYADEAKVSSRPGSFIWDVVLPLRVEAEAISAIPKGQGTLVDVVPQPFGRRVTNRIAQMATTAVALAQRVESGEASIEHFAQPGLEPANSMELESLANLGNTPDAPYQLRLTQSALVQRRNALTRLTVSPAQRRRLAEAAEFLRTTQPQEGVFLEGHVVRLYRSGSNGPGDVTIRAVLDDSNTMKSCVVNLAEEDYAEANRAHIEGLVVAVRGDLTIAGTRKRLINPTMFHVLDMMP